MTQPNLFVPGVLKSLALLLVFSVFVSCSAEDDDVTPQDEDVTFRVELLKIAALEIKEAEGDALEIYGSINTKVVRGNITEANPLWSKAIAEAIAVGVSDTPLMASVTYVVASSDIANSDLTVTADLFDSDGTDGSNPPEDLGKESITTSLANITTSASYDIVLNDSGGQTVKLTYSITRLP